MTDKEIREKLVGFIKDSLIEHIGKSCKLAENIADHLIANGVTFPVRCGDCKYNVANMHIDENDITDYSGIDIVCSYHMSDGFDADDYCSKGQRKENGNE